MNQTGSRQSSACWNKNERKKKMVKVKELEEGRKKRMESRWGRD